LGFFLLFSFFFSVLGFELMVPCWLGMHFTSRAMLPTLFALVIIQIEFPVLCLL
jgi:hypothetical protein